MIFRICVLFNTNSDIAKPTWYIVLMWVMSLSNFPVKTSLDVTEKLIKVGEFSLEDVDDRTHNNYEAEIPQFDFQNIFQLELLKFSGMVL